MKPIRTRALSSSSVGALLLASMAGGEPAHDETRALVARIIAEDAARSSLLAGGGESGHSSGQFRLVSPDGLFGLVVRGQIQFRYYVSLRDDNDGDGDGFAEDDFESGFQTRRTKLFFEGHAWDPALTYRINGAFSRSTGDWRLEDAYARYAFGGGFAVTAGAFKPPFWREENTSSGFQLAAERSIVNDVFSLVRSQGVRVEYEQESWRAAVAFSDGAGAESSEFGSERSTTASGLLNRAGLGESDYALTGRLEYKPFGEWRAFKDFTSAEGSGYALMFGVAGHVEGGDPDSSAFTAGTYKYTSWAADMTVEGDGWNFHAAGVGGYTEFNDTAVGDVSNEDYGLVVQGGVMIPGTDWEPFARYAGLFVDDDRGADEDLFNSVTVGVNYYMYGHASKLTVDVVWYLEETDPLVASRTNHGQLGDDDDGEVTIRVQWQLLF